MLSQWFVHPALLGGLALLAVPIIIHLIHRFRFKRVRWAAMEFLLDSQRRNRRRLLLEHLILLLLRCALIALVVFLVARPQSGGRLAQMLAGGEKTQHVIVLDDSFSMGQSTDNAAQAADGTVGGTAFHAAADAVTNLVRRLAQRPGAHILTLIRTSSPQNPDLLSVQVDDSVLARVEKLLGELAPSSLASAPAAAVGEAKRMLDEGATTSRVLHVLSDFQSKDWSVGSEVYAPLRELASSETAVQLVDATRAPAANLAVIDIKASLGSVAAGVPFAVEATVKNFSDSPVLQLGLLPRVDGQPLPAATIDRINPDEAATATFEVALASPGVHEVAVEIREDGLPADNLRSLAVDVPPAIPVLLVDGSRDRRDSLYLSLALAPGGGVQTGLATEVRTIDRLRDEDLSRYRAVYLLNVPAVDAAIAKTLMEYVTKGGGLAVFLGDQSDPTAYNEILFQKGKGLLPAAVVGQKLPQSDRPANSPDLRVATHPVFRVFAEQRNSFLETISVRQFWQVDEKQLAEQSEVIARYRDGSALVIDRTLGDGRVLFFGFAAGDAWTSWPQNPTYVVAMLLLNDYLSKSARAAEGATVGEPWIVRFDPAQFRREVAVTPPPVGAEPSLPILIQAEIEEPSDRAATESTTSAAAIVDFSEAVRQGVYRMTRTAADGTQRVEARAFNLAPAESDLSKVAPSQLADAMEGVSYTYERVEDYTGQVEGRRLEMKDWLLIAAAVVLLAEQLLGYRLGFHR